MGEDSAPRNLSRIKLWYVFSACLCPTRHHHHPIFRRKLNTYKFCFANSKKRKAVCFCKLELGYDSPRTAATVFDAIKHENEKFVFGRLKGSTLVLSAEAKNLLSLLHTVEDLLACVSVAEKVVLLQSK